MNAVKSKNIGPRKFVRNLPQRIDLKSSNKQLTFKKSSIYYRLKNIKKEYKNTKLKIILSTSNDEFDLLDGSYEIYECI